MTGCKIFVPFFGDISVMKTAAPMAKGVAMIADKKVTINEPAIIGNAPTIGLPSAPICPGFQFITRALSFVAA